MTKTENLSPSCSSGERETPMPPHSVHGECEGNETMAASTLQDLDWLDEDCFEEPEMWVFGYGSLCWHQGFVFEKSLTGHIRGFSRKFWQGNVTHRGTQQKPGRVATLIEENDGVVWGRAFQVKDKEAFSYLNHRECELGGYLTIISTFYPRPEAKGDRPTKPFPVIVYLATPSNRLWLGDSPLADIANQIVECTGSSGHNVEYLLKLAVFIRENIPEAEDEHLFTLERLVRSQIKEKNLSLNILMGELSNGKMEEAKDGGANNPRPARRNSRTDSFHFTTTISTKTLRCVNIS